MGKVSTVKGPASVMWRFSRFASILGGELAAVHRRSQFARCEVRQALSADLSEQGRDVWRIRLQRGREKTEPWSV